MVTLDKELHDEFDLVVRERERIADEVGRLSGLLSAHQKCLEALNNRHRVLREIVMDQFYPGKNYRETYKKYKQDFSPGASYTIR